MADRKITDLTALAAGSQATGDLLTIVDVSESAAADKNKKITVESLFKGIPGDVGIGDSAPDFNLVIKGGSNTNENLFACKDSDGTKMVSVEQDSSGNGRLLVFDTSGNNDVLIHTNGNSFFNGGNVGIGTSSPTQKLSLSNGTFKISGTSTFASNVEIGRVGGDNNLGFATGGTERMRINASGNVGIGTTSISNKLEVDGGSGQTRLRVSTTGTDADEAGIILANSGKTAFNDGIEIAHGAGKTNFNDLAGEAQMTIDVTSSRVGIGTTSPTSIFDVEIASNTGINFTNVSTAPILDFKANSVESAGRIRVNEASGGGVMQFATKTTGGTITERMRVTSAGYLKASNNGSYVNTSGLHHEFNQSATGDVGVYVKASSTAFASDMLFLSCARSSNSNFYFLVGRNDNTANNAILLRGDGNAFADGSWSGGGADYAEYFEWSDGNTEAEDRRGISVVLDGDKIREAVAGEEPIGVISGNPSVVGDGDVNQWKNKHLRDDYGSFVLDENGDRQVNPDYNPDTAYVSRENRPEWDTVGLMGKLRIRKGQVTGARWIKMRDVSDSVEEWLVR